MIDEEPLCCMCGTSKFVGLVNAGKKYYCNTCMKKLMIQAWIIGNYVLWKNVFQTFYLLEKNDIH